MGIVSTLYISVFNRITKIASIAIIKYSSYIEGGATTLIIFTSYVLSTLSFSLEVVLGKLVSLKTTTSDWSLRIVNMLFKIGLYISQVEPLINHISFNKSYFFISLFGDLHKLILYPSIVFEKIITKFNLNTLIDYLKFSTGYVYYLMRAYYSLKVWTFIIDLIASLL